MNDHPNRYLERRPGGWYVNKRLPKHLQPILNTASIRRALHTGDVVQARQRRDAILERLDSREPFESLFEAWKEDRAEDRALSEAPSEERGAVIASLVAGLSTKNTRVLEADCLRMLNSLDAMDSIIQRLSGRLAALGAQDQDEPVAVRVARRG